MNYINIYCGCDGKSAALYTLYIAALFYILYLKLPEQKGRIGIFFWGKEVPENQSWKYGVLC